MKKFIRKAILMMFGFLSILTLSCKVDEDDNRLLYAMILLSQKNAESENSKKEYVVRFNINDGSENPEIKTQLFSNKVPKNLFSLEQLGFSNGEYCFVGWSTKPDSTYAEFLDAEEYNASGDITLYAIWEEYSLKTGIEINKIFTLDLNAIEAVSFKRALTCNVSAEYYLDRQNSVPVWFDVESKTIFYFCKSKKLRLNPDSSDFFKEMSCLSFIELSEFDTNCVNSMRQFFYGCSSLADIDLTQINTSKVKDMSSIFENCISLRSLDFSNLDITNVTNFSRMLFMCSSLQKITVKANTDWNKSVSDCNSEMMFYGCKNLSGSWYTKYIETKTDISYARIDKENASGYFTDPSELICTITYNSNDKTSSSLKIVKCRGGVSYNLLSISDLNFAKEGCIFSGWSDSSDCTSKIIFKDNETFTPTNNITLYAQWAKFIKSGPDINQLFKNNLKASEATSFIHSESEPGENADIFYLDEEEKVPVWYDSDSRTIYYRLAENNLLLLNKDSSSLFLGMNKLISIETKFFDTSYVETMEKMFSKCSCLKELDLSMFNTSNVKSMRQMFSACRSIKELNLSSFDTSNVKDMYDLFGLCNNLEDINLSSFNTEKLENSRYMFIHCEKITNLDLSNFYTPNLKDISHMFERCTSLVLLDISNFDIFHKYLFTEKAFYYCSSLQTIYCYDLEPVSQSDRNEDTFCMCENLVGESGVKFGRSCNGTPVSLSLKEYFSCKEPILKTGEEINRLFEKINAKNAEYFKKSICPPSIQTECFLDYKKTIPVWYETDSKTIYYYSPNNKLFLNCDSRKMFKGMSSLISIETTDFDSSKVKILEGFFQDCSSLKYIDISSLILSNENVRINCIFRDCVALEKIYASENINWENAKYKSYAFDNCTNLIGGKGTVFSSEHIGSDYARIDHGDSMPGYFTKK